MIESSLVTYHGRIIDINTGTPSSVEFNFERIWEFKRKCADFNPFLLDFYHVHPRGLESYSVTDLNCMLGFVMAFGSDFYFHIIVFEYDDLHSTLHKDICYAPLHKTSPIQILKLNSPYQKLSSEAVAVLKLLSYGEKQ